MGRPNEVKQQFATLLESALIERFGELPSNTTIAREFNLRAYNVEPITQESVRRWRNGISMPEERRLKILVSWLNLDLRRCFQTSLENLSLQALNGIDSPKEPQSQAPINKGLSSDERRLLRLINSLTQSDKQMIEQLAKKLSTRVRRQT